jgi:C_GCAxxG_C_C family probable redox protein
LPVAEQDEGGVVPARRALVAMVLGGPACLVAGRAARASDGSPGPDAPGGPPSFEDDRAWVALSRFREGYHCSQSVLAAYAERGLSEAAALRMGAALAGGSTVGGECGAVAAGYLVLGLRHGRTVPAFGDVERERELFERIRSFVGEFRRRHGAITCRELLGLDVFTPEGLAEGRRRGLFRERCPVYVRDAIAILESLDADPPAAPGPGPDGGR